MPKIIIKDILIFGIKTFIVFEIYMWIQRFILELVSLPLNLPPFELEDLLLNWSETIHILFNHNPLEVALFIIFGGILFYITTFFLEIAYARLIDTGSLLAAFNVFEIKKDIDIMGWKNYQET